MSSRRLFFLRIRLHFWPRSLLSLSRAGVFSPILGICSGLRRLRFNKRLLASLSSPLEIYLGISPPFLCAAFELSEEDYYLCAMCGPGSPFYKKQWQQTLDPTVRWIADARAHCHILVWGILISWAITSVVVVSLYRCYSTDQKAKIQKQAI